MILALQKNRNIRRKIDSGKLKDSNKLTKTWETPKVPITHEAFEGNLVNFLTHSKISSRAVEVTYLIKMLEDLNINNNGIQIGEKKAVIRSD